MKIKKPSTKLANFKNLGKRQRGLLIFTLGFACFGTVSLYNSFALRQTGEGFGAFYSFCEFSHRSNDDPIVFPGKKGAAHSHDFFGATTLDQNSTNESIKQGGTTCVRSDDGFERNKVGSNRSAYWIPTLYVNDQPVQSLKSSSSYRTEYKSTSTIEPFPAGWDYKFGQGCETIEVNSVYLFKKDTAKKADKNPSVVVLDELEPSQARTDNPLATSE